MQNANPALFAIVVMSRRDVHTAGASNVRFAFCILHFEF